MGLKIIDVTDVEFNGSDVILEHLDEVTETRWNRFVENSACTYYLPHVALTMGRTGEYFEDVGELWGCIPPSNPATDPDYTEKFLAWVSLEVTKATGTGTITIQGGTSYASLSNLLSPLVFTASGTYEGVLIPEETVTKYTDDVASPYYIRATFEDDTGAYILDRFDVYYRKWSEPSLPYEGVGTLQFDRTTGTDGTYSGTDGSGNSFSGVFTATNLTTQTINNDTFPYSQDYLQIGASGLTGSLTIGYTGDDSPHATYNYTRATFTGTYHWGTGLMDGTLATYFPDFITDGTEVDDLKVNFYTSSGTSYMTINAGTFLAVGQPGTTVELGTWVADGTSGFMSWTLSGINYDETEEKHFFSVAALTSPFGVPTTIVNVYLIQRDFYFQNVFEIDFYTSNSVCPVGIHKITCSRWGL